jgi:hypothetical protein
MTGKRADWIRRLAVSGARLWNYGAMNCVGSGIGILRKTRGVLLVSLLVLSALGMTTVGAAGAQKVTIENFTSPSGNIHCLVMLDETDTSADCTVLKPARAKLKTKPADCELDWDPTEILLIVKGTKTSVEEGGCRGDIGPYCPGDCKRLAFGSSVNVGKIRCTSLPEGIQCQTTTGKRKGFLIAARSWKRI